MKKMFELVKKYKLGVLIALNLILASGLSIYAYYKSNVLMPQDVKKAETEVKEEIEKETINEKIDFSAKRAKRERDYFANAQTYPTYTAPVVVEEKSAVENQTPTVEIPEKTSIQSESSEEKTDAPQDITKSTDENEDKKEENPPSNQEEKDKTEDQLSDTNTQNTNP